MTTATAPAPAAPPAAPASATSGGQPASTAPAQPTTSAQPPNPGTATPAPAGTAANAQPAGTPPAAATSTASNPSPTPPANAPAAVAIEVKLPEKTLLAAEAAQGVKDFATKHGLTQEAAQAVLDGQHGAVQAYADKAQQAWDQRTRVDWVNALKADPELGGAKYEETVALKSAFLARFATPEFAQMLEKTGWGNQPDLVRAFARAGLAMREDKFVASGGGGSSKGSEDAQLRAMYPTMFR